MSSTSIDVTAPSLRPWRRFLARAATAVAVLVPPLGVASALGLLWGVAVRPVDLALLLGFYLVTGVGITVGFHRLFTHASFDTSAWLRAALAILGSLALEGSVASWAAEHRMHHAFSDADGDPHSPHASRGPGIAGRLTGLWHAHMGWFFTTKGVAAAQAKYRRDLDADPVVRTVDRLYWLWILLTFGIPFLVGYAVGGTAARGFEAFVWAGLIRILLVHHLTWSINSVCHAFGKRPYKARDESRNNWLLALPTMGEAWHNNHHAFPGSAIFGLDRGQVDLGGLVIRGLERLGLVWNVKRPAEAQLAARRQRDGSAS